MNKVFLHSKNSNKKEIVYYFVILLIFLLFGFYKNGLLLYKRDYISFIKMYNPLLLYGISLIVTFIYSKIYKENILSNRLVYNILISLVVPYNVNLIAYVVILVIINFIYHYLNVNLTSLFMVIYIIMAILFRQYSFLNIFESSNELQYGFIDFLLGKGIGGISNTFLILSIGSFILFLCRMIYKRQIPIVAFCTYYILMTINTFIVGSANIELLLSNNLVFAFIFIAPISKNSPYTKGGCYIFGLLLGLLSFALSYFDLTLGVYVSILFLSICTSFLDKLFVGNSNKKEIIDNL